MSPLDKRTLTAIRRHWAQHGCSPSYQQIEDGGGPSKGNIEASLTRLAALGLVTFTRGKRRSVRPTDPLAAFATADLLRELNLREVERNNNGTDAVAA